MREFKVGDEVGSLLMGHGIVVAIDTKEKYSIKVCFSVSKDTCMSYTDGGLRLKDDLTPEIYHLDVFKDRFGLPLYVSVVDYLLIG